MLFRSAVERISARRRSQSCALRTGVPSRKVSASGNVDEGGSGTGSLCASIASSGLDSVSDRAAAMPANVLIALRRFIEKGGVDTPKVEMAERVRFELTVLVKVHTLSKRAP